jgi:hypothetical protein
MSGVYNSVNTQLNTIPLYPLNAKHTPTELIDAQEMLSKYNFKYDFVRKENVYRQNLIFTPNLRFRHLNNIKKAENNNVQLIV